MVGVEYRRPDRLDGLDGLVDGHRVGLVDRQEGDVDILQRDVYKRQVTDLPPALVAEAPVAADLKLFGETLPERGAPFVMRGHVRSAGLRAKFTGRSAVKGLYKINLPGGVDGVTV